MTRTTLALVIALMGVYFLEDARAETYIIMQGDDYGVRTMTVQQGDGYAVIWTETDIGLQSELVTITPDHDGQDVLIVPVQRE